MRRASRDPRDRAGSPAISRCSPAARRAMGIPGFTAESRSRGQTPPVHSSAPQSHAAYHIIELLQNCTRIPVHVTWIFWPAATISLCSGVLLDRESRRSTHHRCSMRPFSGKTPGMMMSPGGEVARPGDKCFSLQSQIRNIRQPGDSESTPYRYVSHQGSCAPRHRLFGSESGAPPARTTGQERQNCQSRQSSRNRRRCQCRMSQYRTRQTSDIETCSAMPRSPCWSRT